MIRSAAAAWLALLLVSVAHAQTAAPRALQIPENEPEPGIYQVRP